VGRRNPNCYRARHARRPRGPPPRRVRMRAAWPSRRWQTRIRDSTAALSEALRAPIASPRPIGRGDLHLPPAPCLSRTSHRRTENRRDQTRRAGVDNAKNPCKTGLRVSRRDRPGPRFTGSNPVGAKSRTALRRGFFDVDSSIRHKSITRHSPDAVRGNLRWAG